MADNCSVITQHDTQLLFFSETNNRSRFKFKSKLSAVNYRGFMVPQNLESGADFDQVGIEVLASGLYHWKFQSVGFSYCGYLQGQNIGLVDVNQTMYPVRLLVVTLVTILLGAVMVHVYSMTYADRPAVRPKISGPCCPNIDDIPHKTLQDKEAEIELRNRVQSMRPLNLSHCSSEDDSENGEIRTQNEVFERQPISNGITSTTSSNESDSTDDVQKAMVTLQPTPAVKLNRATRTGPRPVMRQLMIKKRRDSDQSSDQVAGLLQSSLVGISGKILSDPAAHRRGLKQLPVKKDAKKSNKRSAKRHLD